MRAFTSRSLRPTTTVLVAAALVLAAIHVALAANPDAQTFPAFPSCSMPSQSGYNPSGPTYSYAATTDSQFGACSDTAVATNCSWNGNSYDCNTDYDSSWAEWDNTRLQSTGPSPAPTYQELRGGGATSRCSALRFDGGERHSQARPPATRRSLETRCSAGCRRAFSVAPPQPPPAQAAAQPFYAKRVGRAAQPAPRLLPRPRLQPRRPPLPTLAPLLRLRRRAASLPTPATRRSLVKRCSACRRTLTCGGPSGSLASGAMLVPAERPKVDMPAGALSAAVAGYYRVYCFTSADDFILLVALDLHFPNGDGGRVQLLLSEGEVELCVRR